jgi:ribosomal-protein-alanine N-acetyltransferase
MIETENLQLVPCQLEHLEAILRDKKELEPMLNVKVPDTWPEFPESIPHLYELFKSESASAASSSFDWGFYLFVHKKDRVLVGEGGYKGTPDREGMVEIGYAIVPEYRRRGLAFEAARGLATHAFSHAEVRVVQAHTLPTGDASIGVLKKLGMKFVGSFQEPEDGEVLRWRVERKDYV